MSVCDTWLPATLDGNASAERPHIKFYMAASDTNPDVSVIIAVRDDVEGLEATLLALEAQKLSPDRYEIVVVDDASEVDVACVTRRYSNVTLISLDQPRGSYAARNRALKAARGMAIAVTDADCRPQPDWLEAGLRYLLRDPTVVVGGHITMPLGANPPLAAQVDVMVHLDQERYVTEEGGAVTANLFASAATFRDVGGFDERLRSSGDLEWTRRAVRAGHPLVYAPEVIVVHPPRTSAKALWTKARRVAEGGQRALHEGLVQARPLYLSPSWAIPRHRARGRIRLREHGVRPGHLHAAILLGAQIVLIQLPQAYFSLVADVRFAWARLRPGSRRRHR